MAINNPKQLFVRMLSAVQRGTEKSIDIYHELGNLAQNSDVKEALEARAFVARKDLDSIDQCFKLMNEKPVQTNLRLQEVFVEDFRRELTEIQSPGAKLLFCLAKAAHLNQFGVAAYETMIAAADTTGHFGIGVILESCLADKLAFMERNRRMIRKLVETRVEERLAA